MPPVINTIFKSATNLKIPPLCQSCQLVRSNQPRLDKIERGLCVKMPMKLVILCLLINVMSKHQANCFQVMAAQRHTINSMVWHFFMTLLQELFELKIKSHLELLKPWWLKNTLNNCYGNRLLLKFATFTVTMESSILESPLKTLRTSTRLTHFLELVLTITKPLLSRVN